MENTSWQKEEYSATDNINNKILTSTAIPIKVGIVKNKMEFKNDLLVNNVLLNTYSWLTDK